MVFSALDSFVGDGVVNENEEGGEEQGSKESNAG